MNVSGPLMKVEFKADNEQIISEIGGQFITKALCDFFLHTPVNTVAFFRYLKITFDNLDYFDVEVLFLTRGRGCLFYLPGTGFLTSVSFIDDNRENLTISNKSMASRIFQSVILNPASLFDITFRFESSDGKTQEEITFSASPAPS